MANQGTNFGFGFLAIPSTGTTNTATPFGLVKDVSIDASWNLVKERGQYQMPIAIGRGAGEVTGKIGSVSLFSSQIGALMGVTPTNASVLGVPGEIGTIPTTPFQITVANSATWVADCGVYNFTAGKWMTRAATATGTGVFAAASGVYTFNTADTGNKVAISYTYTAAASTGYTTALVNVPMAVATGLQLVVYQPVVSGKVLGFKFYNVFFPKLSFALKPDAFAQQNLEFFAAEDGTSGRAVVDVFTAD